MSFLSKFAKCSSLVEMVDSLSASCTHKTNNSLLFIFFEVCPLDMRFNPSNINQKTGASCTHLCVPPPLSCAHWNCPMKRMIMPTMLADFRVQINVFRTSPPPPLQRDIVGEAGGWVGGGAIIPNFLVENYNQNYLAAITSSSASLCLPDETNSIHPKSSQNDEHRGFINFPLACWSHLDPSQIIPKWQILLVGPIWIRVEKEMERKSCVESGHLGRQTDPSSLSGPITHHFQRGHPQFSQNNTTNIALNISHLLE